MINIELRLLTAMSYSGDYSPIAEGDVTLDHFLTDQGKSVFLFMTGYRELEGGMSSPWPPLSVLRSRFDNVPFPDPDPADNVRALAHEVKLLKMRADLATLSQDVEIVSKQVNPLAEVEKLSTRLRQITEKMILTKAVSVADHINEVLLDYDMGNILPAGIPYPWESLTKATKGLHRKEVILVAGRPKSRKTFTAIHIGANAVDVHAKRVLLFTPEMPPRQMLLRVIADLAKVRYTEFKDSALNELELERVLEVAQRFGKLNQETDQEYEFRFQRDYEFARAPGFTIIQSTGQTIDWMRHKIDAYEPDIVLADSAYRQAADKARKNDSDWKAQDALSRAIKDCSMETNTAWVITHQLHRAAEQQLGSLASLSLSDGFGQNMDLVMRVITGKLNGEERSALLCLGAREINMDGVFINNRPSYDYSEIGVITNRKTVKKLLEKDEEEPDEDEDQSQQGKRRKRKEQANSLAADKNIAANMLKHRKEEARKHGTSELDDDGGL